MHCITTEQRDQLTISLLEQVSPFLMSVSAHGHVEFEDLYQDAALQIVQILDRYYEQIHSVRAYVMISVRRLAFLRIKQSKRIQTVSLDLPLSDDLSLGDVVAVSDEDAFVSLLARERLKDLEGDLLDLRCNYQTRRVINEMYESALACFDN